MNKQKTAIVSISLIATILLGSQILHLQIAYGEELEGCGAGYWKNPKHLDEWVITELEPNSSSLVIFVFSQGFFSDPPPPPPSTHLQILGLEGGTPIEKLAKEFLVTALNFFHPDINYGLDEGEILSIMSAAFQNNDPEEILDAKDQLEFYNNMVCPLD